MHKILVPADGSDHALKALLIACDLAEKYGGQVILLHVLAEGKPVSELFELAAAKNFGAKLKTALRDAADNATSKTPELVPEGLLRQVGEKILDQAVDKVRRRGLKADVLAMAVGEPAECILRAQKRINAGTIVMGCRGVSQSYTSTFGSVSHTVFEKAECTCLSVK